MYFVNQHLFPICFDETIYASSITCLPAAANFTNCLEFEISSHESSNINMFFVPVIGRFSISSKVNSLDEFKIFSLHVFRVFGLNVPIFNHTNIRCDFPDPLGPTSEIKTRSL